ncbi:HNH endonuclease [Microcoleus sp. FACHB-1515]|uniref:HNH endonuclease n=1 Tax=Cyanophyceae TaxID=3028117 RepID=UPI0018F01000|nr:HNH endonuclease [Microcoleus sp. FACHB-1515]
MTAHEVSHPESQEICDALLQFMQQQLAGVERKEAEDTCAFFHPEGSRFAYLYHQRNKPETRIYFRANPNTDPRWFPDGVKLQKRLRFDNSWAQRFPYFFDVSASDNLEKVAVFLIEEAYPLSMKLKTKHSRKRLEYFTSEEVEAVKFVEGSVKSIRVNAYERNRKARNACLKHYGTACFICGFSFASFGKSFASFIHVHHLVPISSIGHEYHLDPIKDLRPVCPNCHAVIHRREPPFGIEEVKSMLKKHQH